MKMSSPERRRFEGCSVAQHRPQDIDPPAGEGDERLGMPLTLPSLAVVEGPGLRRAAQTGEGRLVEDPLEDLVATTHPAIVADPLAGVMGCGHQPGISGEAISALEGAQKIAHAHKELGTEDRTHPRQASEDPGLGTSEKTPLELPVEGLYALLEDEYLSGELGDDGSGDALGSRYPNGISVR